MNYDEYDVYVTHVVGDNNNEVVIDDDEKQRQQDQQPMLERPRSSLQFDNDNVVWNLDFQKQVELLKHSIRTKNNEAELKCYHELSRLAHDFTYTATLYGKIIMSEKTSTHKTIKPIELSGVAGGEKYIVNGILFKFADNHRQLYYNDEYATKASNHDIRGCAHVFAADLELSTKQQHDHYESICVPLMAVIKFHGFTLTAIAVLPIDATTLVYGADHGQKPVKLDEKANMSVELLSKYLNLKPHVVKDVLIHTPFDMEIHRGTDGRLYAIDFSRLFPCEAYDPKRSKKGAHLCMMLRPEYVREYDHPLSSDAFCIMSKHSANIHNSEVECATRDMIFKMIPNFSLWLVFQGEYKIAQYPDSVSITDLMHRFGINTRFLFLVLVALVAHKRSLQQVQQQQDDDGGVDDRMRLISGWINVVVVEMVCREIKSQIRTAFRAVASSVSSMTIYRKLCIEYLNKYLLTIRAQHSWKGRQLERQLQRTLQRNWKYLMERVIERYEVHNDFKSYINVIDEDIRLKLEEFQAARNIIMNDMKLFNGADAVYTMNRRQMFMRLQKMLGLWFTPSIYAARSSQGSMAKMVYADELNDIDLVDIREVVKDLNIIAYSEARTFFNRAMNETGDKSIEFLNASINRYKSAVSACGVAYMYRDYANAYMELSIRVNTHAQVLELLGLASQASVHVDDDYSQALKAQSEIIRYHFSNVYGPRVIRQSRGRIYGVSISPYAYIVGDQHGYINIYTHVSPEVYQYSRTDSVVIHNSWVRCLTLLDDGIVLSGGDNHDSCICVSRLSRSHYKPSIKPLCRLNTVDKKVYKSEQSSQHAMIKVLAVAVLYAPPSPPPSSSIASSLSPSSLSSSRNRRDRRMSVFVEPLPAFTTPWDNHTNNNNDDTTTNKFSRSFVRKIVCGLSNGNVQVWELNSSHHSSFICEFSAHISAIYSICVIDHNQEIIATGSEDHRCCIWDLASIQRSNEQIVSNETRRLKKRVSRYFTKNQQQLNATEWDEYKELLANGHIRTPLCEIGSEKNYDETVGHVGWVMSIVRTKEYLATASFDGHIRLHYVHELSNFKTTTKTLINNQEIRAHTYPLAHVFRGHNDGIWSLKCLPQRDVIISGSSDATVRIWSIELLKCVRILTGPTSDVYSVDIYFQPYAFYSKKYAKAITKEQKIREKQKARDERKRLRQEGKLRRKQERAKRKALVPTTNRIINDLNMQDDEDDDGDEKQHEQYISHAPIVFTPTEYENGVITIIAGSADENVYAWIIKDTDDNNITYDINMHHQRSSSKCNIQ